MKLKSICMYENILRYILLLSLNIQILSKRNYLKNPRSTAERFIITESSWLYPVYEAIATIELMPLKKTFTSLLLK